MTRTQRRILLQSAAFFLSLNACLCGPSAKATQLAENDAPSCGVPSRTISTIMLSADSLVLKVGEQETVRARVIDSQGVEIGAPSLEWRSSDPHVAAVSLNGQVSALAPGTATIQVVSRGSSYAHGSAAASIPVRVDR